MANGFQVFPGTHRLSICWGSRDTFSSRNQTEISAETIWRPPVEEAIIEMRRQPFDYGGEGTSCGSLCKPPRPPLSSSGDASFGDFAAGLCRIRQGSWGILCGHSRKAGLSAFSEDARVLAEKLGGTLWGSPQSPPFPPSPLLPLRSWETRNPPRPPPPPPSLPEVMILFEWPVTKLVGYLDPQVPFDLPKLKENLRGRGAT